MGTSIKRIGINGINIKISGIMGIGIWRIDIMGNYIKRIGTTRIIVFVGWHTDYN